MGDFVQSSDPPPAVGPVGDTQRRIRLVRLTDEERAALDAWAARDDRLGKRARVILESARTENVAEISRRAGLPRPSVYLWQERFRLTRLEGIVPRRGVSLRPRVERELETLQRTSHQLLAKRAGFILDLSRTSDFASAARRAGVSLKTAGGWLRVFNQRGAQGLGDPNARGKRTFPTLDDGERAALQRWSQSERAFSRRAQVILALATGASIAAVSGSVGLSVTTVALLRQRFSRDGLKAVAPKQALEADPGQRRGLEELQIGHDQKLSKRASLILDFIDHGDLPKVAERQQISVIAARKWIRAFRNYGIAGLRKLPALPSTRRVPRPVVIYNEFPAELRLETKNKTRIRNLKGVTTELSRRVCVFRLNAPLDQEPLPPSRVTADVRWPARNDAGDRLVLRLCGSVVDWDARMLRIGIRTSAFLKASD